MNLELNPQNTAPISPEQHKKGGYETTKIKKAEEDIQKYKAEIDVLYAMAHRVEIGTEATPEIIALFEREAVEKTGRDIDTARIWVKHLFIENKDGEAVFVDQISEFQAQIAECEEEILEMKAAQAKNEDDRYTVH